jgi:hypothetical protein
MGLDIECILTQEHRSRKTNEVLETLGVDDPYLAIAKN